MNCFTFTIISFFFIVDIPFGNGALSFVPALIDLLYNPFDTFV